MDRIRQSINGGQAGPYERFNNYAAQGAAAALQSGQRQRPLGEGKPKVNYHYLQDALKNSGLASIQRNGGLPEDSEMSRMQYINRNFTNANITNRVMNDQPPMAQSKKYRGDLRDLYDPSAQNNFSLPAIGTGGGNSPGSKAVATEQERYMNRLKTSIERQGHIYQQYANSIVIPQKMQNLQRMEEQIERSKS